MTTRLLADVCRCHDATCLQRHDCLRWLERSSGEQQAASMRREFHTCSYFRSAHAPQPHHPDQAPPDRL